MGKALIDFGLQMAQGAAGGLMGAIFGKGQDRRQIRQQEKLQNMQISGQKQMVDYNYGKELQMWKDTNYTAQMEELKKAGLNPGLLYGMGGGGGATTGSPVGNVSGADAPKGGGEPTAMAGMAMQLGLLQAQKANIEANTEKTKVDTQKTAGVDTEKVKTEILDLTQGVENKKAQEALTRVQTRISQIEETLKDRTLEDTVRAIGWQAGKIMEEMDQAKYETQIKEDTWRDKVSTVKAELMGIWLKNALTKVQTQKTETEIEAIIRKGIQDWKALEIAGQNAQTQDARQKQDAWINDVQKSTQIPMEILREAVDGILRKGTTINKQWNNETNHY